MWGKTLEAIVSQMRLQSDHAEKVDVDTPRYEDAQTVCCRGTELLEDLEGRELRLS